MNLLDLFESDYARDKWNRASAEREAAANKREAEMKARHQQGKEDMSGAIDRLEKHLNTPVNEGSMKDWLWKQAELLSKDQFVDNAGEYGMTPEEAAEWWDDINGVELDEKLKGLPSKPLGTARDLGKSVKKFRAQRGLDEAGIGQDIVNKSEKMARATPQSKAGAVASTVKNAAKWLAGKGGPGKEGPTYESQKKNSKTVEEYKLHDLGAQAMLKKARATHPIAKDDAEALALYIADKEQRDVDRLERENEQEEAMIARIIDQLKSKEVEEGWSDRVVAQRTGRPRTPYSIYIKGRKWKDFENEDHAEAVANKLKAKFEREGRDPSVITIAPTDYDKGVDEVANPAQQAAIAIAMKKAGRKPKQVDEFAPGNGEEDPNDLTDEAFKDGQRLGYSLVDGATRAKGFEVSQYLDKYLVPFSYGWNAGRKMKIKQAQQDGVDLVMKKDGSLVRSGQIDEFAPGGTMKPPAPPTKKKDPWGDDDRSQILQTIKRLLDAGNKVDSMVAGARGHIYAVAPDLAGMSMKKLNKPYAKGGLFRFVSADEDDQLFLKMIKPGYYQLWNKELVDESKEAVFRSHDIEVEYPEGKGHSHIYHRREPYRLSTIFSDANSVAARNRRAKISLFVDGEYIPNYEWQEGVDAPSGGIAEGPVAMPPPRPPAIVRPAPAVPSKPIAPPAAIKKSEPVTPAVPLTQQPWFQGALINQQHTDDKKKDEKKDKEVKEDTGSWIVFDPETKQIRKRFKTHTAGKSYAKTHGLGFASSEYYFDNIKPAVTAEGMTDYQKRRQRERDVDMGKPVTKQRQNKQTDYQKRRAEQKRQDDLGEEWSEKYKRSIDCSHPKGFSQKAHCAGRKKNEDIYMENNEARDAVESAIIRRILVAHKDLLQKFGPQKVMDAAAAIADDHADVEEIGTSDVSAYVHEVERYLAMNY